MQVLQKGMLFDGRYEVIRLLGHGGMASVYLVRHTGLRSLHALKVLHPVLAEEKEIRERFLEEGRIQKRLRHPNIVPVTEIVTDPMAGLVMDYVEGSTLEELVRENPLEIERLLEIFLPVLDAMQEVHRQGIVHRDLKPQNILISHDQQGRPVPMLTDFGIAKVLNAGSEASVQTQIGARMGSPPYMSPEQIRSAEAVDKSADIFALGAILYEAATGRMCFPDTHEIDANKSIRAYTPPEVTHPNIQPRIARAIKKALEPDPKRRFASCKEFTAALVAARKGHGAWLPLLGGASALLLFLLAFLFLAKRPVEEGKTGESDPRTPPPPVLKASLKVKVRPEGSGAELELTDPQGRTFKATEFYRQESADVGRWRIKVKRPRYRDLVEEFELTAGMDKDLILTMRPLPYIRVEKKPSEESAQQQQAPLRVSGVIVKKPSGPAPEPQGASGRIKDFYVSPELVSYRSRDWPRAIPRQSFSWGEARRHCAGLALENGGWNLPTQEELQRLHEGLMLVAPGEPQVFNGGVQGLFWTSSSSPAAGEVWTVDLDTGHSMKTSTMSGTGRVLCTR